MSRKEEEVPERGQVLALDVATHCGYHAEGASGTWNFTESLARNGNKQHKAFRDTLLELMTRLGIRRVVMEDVVVGGPGHGGFRTSVKLAEFRGIVFELCDELGLPEPAMVNPTTVKRFATGDARADKAKMVEACRARWGVEPVDDNEADATHIFMYYCKRFGI